VRNLQAILRHTGVSDANMDRVSPRRQHLPVTVALADP
jgi:hypothetical protein